MVIWLSKDINIDNSSDNPLKTYFNQYLNT